jgi:hypothetical protein
MTWLSGGAADLVITGSNASPLSGEPAARLPGGGNRALRAAETLMELTAARMSPAEAKAIIYALSRAADNGHALPIML